MKTLGFYFILAFLFLQNATAQLSPPGLGTAKLSDWVAVGVRQQLGAQKKWESVSYVGVGRKSNPDNYNPFYKPAIWVFNQEFFHQFRPHWEYSAALSYRRQDNYRSSPPYEHDTPSIKQEFRTYGRLSYTFSTSRIKLVPTLRQEFRKFYAPDFSNVSDDFSWRTRFRLKLTVNLDAHKIHRASLSSEELFSISKETSPRAWTNFDYRESRINLYYSLAPPKIPAVFSFGYMNNLVGKKKPYSVSYLAFDVVLENPFKSRNHEIKVNKVD